MTDDPGDDSVRQQARKIIFVDFYSAVFKASKTSKADLPTWLESRLE